MSRRPWYKRYGGDFVLGTMALSLEEKGAYSLCLDLIYDRGGPIPDDARWLAGMCGVSLRKWSALRERLISTGKLICEHGHLTNGRAEREMAEAAESSREHAENGAKGGRKRAENAAKQERNVREIERDRPKNNHLGQAELKPNQIPEPEKDPPVVPPRGTKSPKVTKDQLKAVWEACPLIARQRSSQADVESSLNAALRRGHQPEAVLAGLLAAYRSDTYSGDKAKGVHRLIDKDRWASFIEPGGDAADVPTPATYDGPPELRAEVARRLGEPYAVSYIDRCRWDGGTRTLHAANSFAQAKLAKDLDDLCRAWKFSVSLPSANDRQDLFGKEVAA
ncbi:YdaU family protein [Phenylobacterium sp.]|uniref:YdaU family protein n=1 Tax=Phenylobacterium sp. TaxID=1871053 RepID=UPI0030015D2B